MRQSELDKCDLPLPAIHGKPFLDHKCWTRADDSAPRSYTL